MPYRLTGSSTLYKTKSLPADIRYNYTYPRRLDLRPGSDLHDKLKDEVRERAQMSHDAVSARYPSWQEIDQKLTAYIDLSDEEEALKDEDVRRPVSIVVPVSYAVLETLLGYLVAAFLNEPIFKYEGVGGEDVRGAMLMERVVAVQTRRAKLGLALHTCLRDSLAYGIGALTPAWVREMGYRTMNNMGYAERVRGLKFEGNKFYNIDPYLYLPDPGYSAHDIQSSEFQAWIQRTNRMNILSLEDADPNSFFNAQYLEHIDGRSVLAMDESERDRDDVGTGTLGLINPVDVIWMHIKLVPAEWKIGSKTYPEKWLIGLAGDEIIIAAGPAEHNHDMFPVAICAPDYDGYSATPISKIETTYGMQTFIDFAFNSHVAEVRKSLHNSFVVDPLMININDVVNQDGPGKIIRTRKRAWGHGVGDYIEQLKVSDVTAGSIGDVQNAINILEKTVGAGDLVSGNVRAGGERRSATEYRETKNSAMLRLERSAKVAGLQLIFDLAYMSASHTQQYMTNEQYIKIAGPYEEELRKFYPGTERALVNPMELLVDFDVIVPDGSIPNSGDPTVWAAMLQMVGAQPALLQKLDVVNIFLHWARIAGAKNVTDFVLRGDKKINVLQDEAIEKQMEAGNIVPMKDFQG